MRSKAGIVNREKDVDLGLAQVSTSQLALWLGCIQYSLTTKRSNQSATHQEGVTLFECTAMLPSMDWALRSAEAMALSATSPPGTQHRLPT